MVFEVINNLLHATFFGPVVLNLFDSCDNGVATRSVPRLPWRQHMAKCQGRICTHIYSTNRWNGAAGVAQSLPHAAKAIWPPLWPRAKPAVITNKLLDYMSWPMYPCRVTSLKGREHIMLGQNIYLSRREGILGWWHGPTRKGGIANRLPWPNLRVKQTATALQWLACFKTNFKAFKWSAAMSFY